MEARWVKFFALFETLTPERNKMKMMLPVKMIQWEGLTIQAFWNGKNFSPWFEAGFNGVERKWIEDTAGARAVFRAQWEVSDFLEMTL